MPAVKLFWICLQEATVEIPGGLGTTEVTIDYTYDSLYRLTAADYDDEDGTFFHYTYDAVGNRLTQDTLAGTNTYAYDIANRLTNVDGVSYTWDNNGNLLTDGTSTYTYNYANMLASVNQGGVVYDYHYSGLGDRLQQLIDGVPTNYTLDINTGLTQVLADGTHTYLYGRGRIAQDGSVTEYFLGDALSSVRQLVDSTDAVSLTQSYEPFGTVLSSEGEGESIYNFTGEIKDSYIKLLYLRSRYMSVDTGRFVTKDVWNGDYTTPMSYNAWLYAYANPVKYTDPSGYCVFFGMDTAFCLALLIGIPTIAGVKYILRGQASLDSFDENQPKVKGVVKLSENEREEKIWKKKNNQQKKNSQQKKYLMEMERT